MMIIAPMFHTNPLCVWTFPYTYQGVACVSERPSHPMISGRPWPGTESPSSGACPPCTATSCIKSIPKLSSIEDQAEVRLFRGAPIPVELIRDFREKFGVTVVDGYGLTEVTGVSSSSLGPTISRIYRPGFLRAGSGDHGPEQQHPALRNQGRDLH